MRSLLLHAKEQLSPSLCSLQRVSCSGGEDGTKYMASVSRSSCQEPRSPCIFIQRQGYSSLTREVCVHRIYGAEGGGRDGISIGGFVGLEMLDACNIPSTHTTQEHTDSMQLAKTNVVADSTGIRLPE